MLQLLGASRFQNFYGIQTGTDNKYLQKITFTPSKIFENVPFFEHIHLKLKKMLIWSQKIFFAKTNMGNLKRRIYTDSKFVSMGSGKRAERSYRQKTLHIRQARISYSFFTVTFLKDIFSSPFQRISMKCCFFGTPSWLSSEKNVRPYWHFLQSLNAYAQKTEHFQTFWKE